MKVKMKIQNPRRLAGNYEFKNLTDFLAFITQSRIRGINPNKLLYLVAKDGNANYLTAIKAFEVKFDNPDYFKATEAARKSGLLKSRSVANGMSVSWLLINELNARNRV